NFRIPGLTPGRYEVRVRREGFKEYVQPGLTLAIGDEADLRIDLEIPGLTQTVNVVAETSSTRSPLALGRTFTNRDIDELPVIARDFVSLTLLTPGIFVDRSTGRSQNLTFAASGQNGRNNTLLADGLSLDEHFNGQSRGSFSLDAVKEFMVRPES